MSTSSSHPSDEPPIRDQVQSYIYDLQERIVTALEAIPSPSSSALPLKFNKREWTREEGGGGIAYTTSPTPASYSTETSAVGWMEKGAVNVSMIHGMLSPPAIKQMSTEHAALRDEELSKCVPSSFPVYSSLSFLSIMSRFHFRLLSDDQPLPCYDFILVI